jgi:hypothetical protein
MSYTRTFNASFALKGGNKTTVVYKLPLTPSDTSTTFFGVHVRNAVTVVLDDVTGSLLVPLPATTKASPFGSANIVSTTASITSAHQLAMGSGFSTAGTPVQFSLAGSVGLRRVLKGVYDAGDPPSLFVAVSSSWDASAEDIAFVSLRLTCTFTGTSNAEAVETALPTPTI